MKIFLLLFLAPFLAHAEGLTLDQAVSEAMQNSPRVMQADATAHEASWKKLEALAAHLPHFSAEAVRYLDVKYEFLTVNFSGNKVAFPSGVPQTAATLRASLLLFDGLSSISQYGAASLNAEAAELLARRERFQVEQMVRERYYEALATQILLGVAEQNIATLTNHLNLAEAMVKSGYSTRFDLLRVQAQLDEAKAERLVAEDNMFLARSNLSEAMALTGDTRTLSGDLPLPEVSSLPEKLALDPSTRDDLLAATKRENASEKNSSSAIGSLFPKVTLFAEQNHYKFGSFDPGIYPNSQFENAYSVGFALSWNIFDGGASIAKAKEAAWAAEQDAQKLRATLISAPEDFELWKRRFISNASLFAARKRSVEESEESVRLASVGLKAGARTSSEFLDAELELFRSRAGLIRAQADADEAWLKLELAAGRKL